MSPHVAMVFAAGFGTRMRPLTDAKPKPLIEVAGRTLLDHALDLVAEVDARAVVNAHYRADQISAHCTDRMGCTVIEESPDLLDTGGGVKHALPLLGAAPIFTLNSDAVWAGPNPLRLLAQAWQPDEMDALLMLVRLDRTVGYSRPGSFVRDAAQRITKDQGGEAYTGAQIIRTEALAAQDQDIFSMHVLWDQAIAAGRAYGLSYPGTWADVGTPDGIALAEAMIAGRDV